MDLQIYWTWIFILATIIPFSRGRAASDHFDILVFSQFWPKTECFVWRKKSKLNKCSLPKHAEWTVHGIWPSEYGKKGPSYCRNDLPFEKDKLIDIVKQLQAKWPNLHSTNNTESFWMHEWEKHGTCAVSLESMDTQNKYFQTGLDLHGRVNIRKILRGGNIVPGGNYSVQLIQDVLQRKLRFPAQFTCYKNSKTGEQYLYEIRICFDKKLKLMSCSRSAGSPTNCDPRIKVNYLRVIPPIREWKNVAINSNEK